MRKLLLLAALPLIFTGCAAQNTRVQADNGADARMAAEEERTDDAAQSDAQREEDEVRHPAEYPNLVG